MLLRVGGAIGASVLFVLASGPAFAKAPSPSPDASATANPNLGPAVTGSAACTISDPQVTEVSGLVVTADGYAVINDSNVERSREKIFFLDGQCRLTRSVGYPSSAFDPEDLAVAKDGTLWVADIGDNTTLTGGSSNRRSSIALWSLAPGSNTPVIHRLAYPDGRARDAEALLIDGAGHPVIITKDPVGEVYTITQPLPASNANPAPLTRAGSFRPQATGTANPYGIVGTAVVTGAAMSPDGKRVAVRTMSDAYEFDVADGDVVEAITGGSRPRITPLPSEPQGEGIAYSRDGTEFLTTSDQPKPSSILRYTPYAPPAPPAPSSTVQAQAPKSADRSFLDSLSLRDVTRIVIGIGVLGVLMIAVGVFAVIRSRRRRRTLLPGSEAPRPEAIPPGEEAAAEASTAPDSGPA
jgi:DNA-binding beta-propeller fold protein YncE